MKNGITRRRTRRTRSHRAAKAGSSFLRGVLMATALVCAGRASAAERDAAVMQPQGMPARIEDALFFDDSRLLAINLRNGTLDPARVTLRIFVFDERLNLKGGVGYCLGDIVQPGTRVPFTMLLEVKDATARDRFVVVIEEVITARRVWHLREPLGVLIAQAGRAADLRVTDLSVDEHALRDAPASPLALPPCACACDTAEAIGQQACGAGALAAFTCTPFSGSCSQGFTCK